MSRYLLLLQATAFLLFSCEVEVYRNLLDDSYLKEHLSTLQELSQHIPYNYYITNDGINWEANLNGLQESKFFDYLSAKISLPKEFNYHITLRILRRGDDVRISSICKSDNTGVVTAIVLSATKDKNGYGEIMFFNENRTDITSTIRANPMWAISFCCRTPYLWQPPSVSTQQGLIFIQIVGSTEEILSSQDKSNLPLPFVHDSEGSPKSITVVQEFLRYKNEKVFVIDNILTKEQLHRLREYVLQAPYNYNEEDDKGETDNVMALTAVDIPTFVNSSIWLSILSAIEHVSGVTGWYPYDVSNNLNEAWDHTRIHPDCFQRDEYTFLLYLNPELNPGELGGTVWYWEEDGKDIIGSVLNKFGRAAIFHCAIPHAARPPHALFNHARLTFAVKVAPTKAEAIIRTWSEKMGNNEDDEDKTEMEWEQLLLEKFAKYNNDVNKLENEFLQVMASHNEEYGTVYAQAIIGLGNDPKLKVEL